MGGYLLRINQNKLEAGVATGHDQYILRESLSLLENDVWYHAVLSYDTDNKLRLYLDSVLQGTSVPSGSIYYDDMSVIIGKRTSESSGYFKGVIDDVMIFNKALSQEEITDIFNVQEKPVSCVDSDYDGYYTCNPEDPEDEGYSVDCDDSNPAIYPFAIEICDDDLDNDCDGDTDMEDSYCCIDYDSDDYCYGIGPGDDCNDYDASIYPGAIEDCYDGLDNDCDGFCDMYRGICTDGTPGDPDCCIDYDGDGYDNCYMSEVGGDIYPFDCNDYDRNINPSATEDCYDYLDNDCDGDIDSEDSDCLPA